MSSSQEEAATNTRLTTKSAPLTSVQLASKNPLAGQKSYCESKQDTKRHCSAPLENKVFTNYCSVVDHDDLKNKGVHKSLGSLEKNYTRGVRENETMAAGTREEHLIIGGLYEIKGKTSSKGRPLSPTPSAGSHYSVTTSNSLQLSKPVPKPDDNRARPQEWTKQRVHETNMEWRPGYEVTRIYKDSKAVNCFFLHFSTLNLYLTTLMWYTFFYKKKVYKKMRLKWPKS